MFALSTSLKDQIDRTRHVSAVVKIKRRSHIITSDEIKALSYVILHPLLTLLFLLPRVLELLDVDQC